MLDLVLNPGLKASLAEAFLREARRAGVSLTDIELLSYDVDVVHGFLAAVREKRAGAYLRAVDRDHLEGLRTGADALPHPLAGRT